jgi:CubicO group peptidase (beta-lactamase class C family)
MKTNPILAGLILLAAAVAFAQTPKDVAGRYEGSIQIPGAPLKVIVELKDGTAGLGGTIDIPQQGARGVALEKAAAGNGEVTFAIAGIPGAPTFRARVGPDFAKDGTLSGQFTQGPGTFPFTLKRASTQEKAKAALDGFAAAVEAILKAHKAPGAGIAIVKDDTVVFSDGIGLRNLETKAKVSRDTLFAIGSSTKAFTALSVALLVDDGKLAWDEPVSKVLPEFRLQDRSASERLTPRDLLTHRSGLPRHDLLWYGADFTREDMVRRVAYLEPSADLRAKWQYQNLMFMTAGYLAGKLSGTSWEALVKGRIFDPLGMKTAGFSVADMEKAPDAALGYNVSGDQAKRLPYRNISAVGPAGSINASALEMAQWVRLHLAYGRIGDTRIASEATIREMHQPFATIDARSADPEIQNPGYGLGWFVDNYRGRVRVHHGGNIDGFSAMVAMIPSENVGVVVLTNANGTPAASNIANLALDRMLGLEPIDWSGRAVARRDAAKAASEKAKKATGGARKAGTRPAHALAEYAGEYEHPGYGVVTVTEKAGALRARLHAIELALEHWHFETFNAIPEDPAVGETPFKARFETSVRGDVVSLELPLDPLVSPIRFKKKPPARLLDPAFLATLAGDYRSPDNPGLVVTVAVSGPNLTATVPGQPAYVLVPYSGVEFDLKGLTGYSMRFNLDPALKPLTADLLQPDGVYNLRRP